MAAKQRTSRRPRRDAGEEYGSLPYHQKHDEPWARPRQEAKPRRVEPLRPKTDAQAQYMAELKGKTLTVALGPAGTGKTYISASIAADLLREGAIEKFIATRPAVTSEEDLGFMPGGVHEKFAPYFAPILDVLNQRLGPQETARLIKEEKIVAMPIGFMRGHSFRNAFVLVDEAQNTTPGQLKMILTRIAEGTKICVEGDLAQSDLSGPNGLADIVRRFRSNASVGVVEFEERDIVRSGFVRDVLRAYRATSCPAPAEAPAEVEPHEIGLPSRYLPSHA